MKWRLTETLRNQKKVLYEQVQKSSEDVKMSSEAIFFAWKDDFLDY